MDQILKNSFLWCLCRVRAAKASKCIIEYPEALTDPVHDLVDGMDFKKKSD
jgi:hypothetical protein